MTTIRVYPGGGGDYTSIQACEDVADETFDDIEVDGSGDLGALTWNNTALAAVTIRFKAGNQHDGSDSGTTGIAHTTGTWVFNGGTASATVRGIRLSLIVVVATSTTRSLIIEDCLIKKASAGSSLSATAIAGGTTNLTVVNSVCYPATATTRGEIVGFAISTSVGNSVVNIISHNNTLRNTGGTSSLGVQGQALATATFTATVNITVENTDVFDFTTKDFGQTLIGSGGTEVVNWTANNNASSDATADDFGGTGHQINQNAEDWFVDVASDLKHTVDSPGLLAGKTLAGFSTDAFGTLRPAGRWDTGFHQRSLSGQYGDLWRQVLAVLAGRRRGKR